MASADFGPARRDVAGNAAAGGQGRRFGAGPGFGSGAGFGAGTGFGGGTGFGTGAGFGTRRPASGRVPDTFGAGPRQRPAADGTARAHSGSRPPDSSHGPGGSHRPGGSDRSGGDRPGGFEDDRVVARSADALAPAPAVRPFLLTSGRVAGGAGLVRPIPVETQVVATEDGLAALDSFAFEHRDIVGACRRPQSIAEIAARLRLHLNVIRVLADDLRADGQLALYVPGAENARDTSVLRRVIDGLRAVPDTGGLLHDN